jgi:hypothetical protein
MIFLSRIITEGKFLSIDTPGSSFAPPFCVFNQPLCGNSKENDLDLNSKVETDLI